MNQNNNLLRYQNNINDFLKTAPDKLDFHYKCLPLIYYSHYEDNKSYENSNKIILPQKILNELSGYHNIEYPTHFTINDSNIIFTPLDFKEDIEEIFIPQHFLENLGIDINDEIKLTLLNYKIPKGNKVTLKPHTSNFLEITNHKNYLERNLVKLYSTLTEGQTLMIPNLDTIILVDVLECQPEKLISIIDTDIEVEFEAPWDYVEPKKEPLKDETFEEAKSKFKLGKFNFSLNRKKNVKKQNTENKEEPKFSGEGRKLNE